MDRLRVLAETQGYFTRQDALQAGHDDLSIRRSVKTRVWRRVRVGAYTFPDLWPPSGEGVHLLTAHAAAAKLGPAVALSHVSGALEHGMRLWEADLSLTHVTRLDGGAGRTESGVQHHEGLTLPSDVVTLGERQVLTPARVAIETAALLSPEAGLVVLDSALHLDLCTRAQLDATFDVMRHWPGMLRAQLPVRMADPGGQSVGESRGRWLFYLQGLPAPVLQYHVYDEHGRLIGICDYAWPDYGLLAEFDGMAKYLRLLRPGETPGEAVTREKRREDLLREATTWPMIRLTWPDLYSPVATAARVRRHLKAAA